MPHASLLTQRDVRGSVSDIDWLPGTQAWQRDRFVPAGLKQRQRAKVRVPESEIVIELEFEDDKEPVWLRPTAQALVDLLDLPENWDSYGARPVNPETVRCHIVAFASRIAHKKDLRYSPTWEMVGIVMIRRSRMKPRFGGASIQSSGKKTRI